MQNCLSFGIYFFFFTFFSNDKKMVIYIFFFKKFFLYIDVAKTSITVKSTYFQIAAFFFFSFFSLYRS